MAKLGRWLAKLGRWVAKLGRWVAKLGRWVAKSGRRVAKSGRWVAKSGTWVSKLGRWVAKLVGHLLIDALEYKCNNGICHTKITKNICLRKGATGEKVFRQLNFETG